MTSIEQIIDDIGNDALESSILLAGLAVMSDSGEIIIQTKNWDLSNQTNILMAILNGEQSFLLNDIAFTVVQSSPEGIVGTNVEGIGHIIMVPFQGGTLIAYALPRANLAKTLDFLNGYKPLLESLIW